MKKLLLTLFITVGFIGLSFGQMRFGVGASLLEGEFGIHGKVNTGIGQENLRGQGGFTYFFVDNATSFALDFDIHYQLLQIGENINLNPFAGLNVFSVSADGFDGNTELGINLGAAFIYDMEGSFDVFVEPKFIVISDANGFGITAGILF